MSDHKFEFPVVRDDLTPERRGAIAAHFMHVAEQVGRLTKKEYPTIRKKQVKKGMK